MKTVVYYIFDTGNSLRAAVEIATQLGDTEIVPLQKALKSA